MTVNFAIEAQGALMALANTNSQAAMPDARRGKVCGFSAASRLRLIRKLARVNARSAIFLTLTFPERYPDAAEAKSRLRAFFERCRRRWPRATCVWRMEPQERGAPHFHMLWFGIDWMPIGTLRDWWHEINADLMNTDPIQIDIKKLRAARRVMAYVSKYTAKLDEYSYRTYDGDLFLDDGAYLHAGRVWGVHNKQYMPVEIRVFLTFDKAPDALFAAIKDMLRERWQYLNDMPGRGGVVFAADAYTLFAQAAKLARRYE